MQLESEYVDVAESHPRWEGISKKRSKRLGDEEEEEERRRNERGRGKANVGKGGKVLGFKCE